MGEAKNKSAAAAPIIATESVTTSPNASSAGSLPSTLPLQWDSANRHNNSSSSLPAPTECLEDSSADQEGAGVGGGNASSLVLLPFTSSSVEGVNLYPTEEEQRPPFPVGDAGTHTFFLIRSECQVPSSSY